MKVIIFFNRFNSRYLLKALVLTFAVIKNLKSASGIIWNICGTGSDEYLSLVDVRGQFANGDVLYNRLGDSFTISSGSLGNYEYPLNSGVQPKSSVINSGIAKYTGEILYHENISPITRRLDQKEEFKFIFEF